MGQELVLIRTCTHTDEFIFSLYKRCYTFLMSSYVLMPKFKGPTLQALNSSGTHKLYYVVSFS